MKVVRSFTGHTVTNAAGGVRHISIVSRYDVAVKMHHCLPGRSTTVHAVVVSVRRVLLF